MLVGARCSLDAQFCFTDSLSDGIDIDLLSLICLD